jgi:hypothetical protein
MSYDDCKQFQEGKKVENAVFAQTLFILNPCKFKYSMRIRRSTPVSSFKNIKNKK